jgi:hypothetical protein
MTYLLNYILFNERFICMHVILMLYFIIHIEKIQVHDYFMDKETQVIL